MKVYINKKELAIRHGEVESNTVESQQKKCSWYKDDQIIHFLAMLALGPLVIETVVESMKYTDTLLYKM